MKNQYFGDVNDYRKYGLLRSLLSANSVSLLVAWMLTPNDGGRDGRFRSYLATPDTWARYDRSLFAGLEEKLRQPIEPSVSLIEGSDLLPRASYYSEEVPDKLCERDAWRDGLLRAARGVDLVFLDPDNGIEVPWKPIGRKGSSKYLAWGEIKALWNAGSSLLIYQHFPRVAREPFIQRISQEVSERTGAEYVEAFRTPHVLFLLAAQKHHVKKFADNFSVLAERWKEQIKAMGWLTIGNCGRLSVRRA